MMILCLIRVIKVYCNQLHNAILDFFLKFISDILKYIVHAGYNKDKANKIIQNGKNKYWKSTKIQQNNKLVFELLDNSDNQDKSQRGDIKNENK